MVNNNLGCLGLLGGAVLAVGIDAARAQNAVMPVVVYPAPGVVLVMQQAAPDPFAVMRQMDAQMDAQMGQMMAQMQANMATLAAQTAAQTSAPTTAGPVAGVVVTSFSDGRTSCTRRIVYPGDGGPAKIAVSETGNGCAGLGVDGPGVTTPAAVPLPASPAPRANPPVLVVADRDN